MRLWCFNNSVRAALWITSALALGCGGDSGGGPTGPGPNTSTPATVTAITALSRSDTVASTLTATVQVRDATGAAMSGVSVTFSITAGGGSVSPATVSTDANGFASTAWKLGTNTGNHEMRASVPGLTPVSFTAQATPGAPTVVLKRSGDNQEGIGGQSLEQTLSVEVRDTYGNRVPGTPVTFAVTSGGGTILGSPAVANSEAIATSGQWTLGMADSTQTVTASVGDGSVLFTARADLCPAAPLDIGTIVGGSLQAGDCQVAGALADKFYLTTSAQAALTITIASAAFDPQLLVSRVSGTAIANDQYIGDQGVDHCVFAAPPDGCHTPSTSAPGSPLALLAAPGAHVVTATSADQQGGAYTLSAVTSTDLISGCRTVFVERGVSTAQTLQETDCGIIYGGNVLYYSDDVLTFLKGGSTLQVTLTTSAFTPWLEFYSPTGEIVGGCAGAGSTSCSLVASVDGYYLISASSFEEHAEGAYLLTVN